jgi:hypothetical protein
MLAYFTSASPANTSQQPFDFYPFPKKSSFLWYWNSSVKKSQQSFKDLIAIVGDPSFHPDNVHNTKWNRINIDCNAGWLDEDVSWQQKHMEIKVHFHRRIATPSPQQYAVADLHY